MSRQAAVRESPVLLEALEERLLLSTGVTLQATASRGVDTGVTIDYVAYPLDSHVGNPWSQWGKGLVASNGKVYTAIGDHGPSTAKGIDGNSYVYEYDPETRVLRCIFDSQSSIADYTHGVYGWGKIHGRINEGADGNLYFATYWGTSGDDPNYLGDHIFRLNPYTGVSTDLGTVSSGNADYGFPSTNMNGSGMVWYAEALDKHTYTYSFLAYDVAGMQVKFLGAHTSAFDSRAMFVDAAGNAYFNAGGNTLQKYDVQLNAETTLYTGMPGNMIRQVTVADANGVMYGLTGDTYKLFSFDPSTGAFASLLTLSTDTAAMEMDPTGHYLYYVPGSHNAADTTLHQYDIATGQDRSIVQLGPYIASTYNVNIGGSYNLTVSQDGRVVYFGVNGDTVPSTDGFDVPTFMAIHIPDNGQTVFKSYPVATPTSVAFTDVAGSTGVADLFRQYSHGAAWGDVNNDGYPDIFMGSFNNGPNRLLINQNGTSFTESVQTSINITGMRTSGAVFADFDNDGDEDLLVIDNKGSVGNRLYANDGSGNFTDVTAASNLNFGTTFAGRNPLPLDYDGDGLLDVFIQQDPFGNGTGSRLMRNTGNLVFQDVTTAAGIGSITGLGAASGDLNGDTLPDLMSVYEVGGAFSIYEYLNNGNGTFRSAGTSAFTAGWAPPQSGSDDWIAGVNFGDLNRDGRMDVVIGQHYESALKGKQRVSIRVYRNDGNDGSGNPIFTDVTAAAGIVGVYVKQPGVEIADFDNDGYMDILTSATIAVGGVQTPVIFHNTMGSTGQLGFELPPGMDPATYTGYSSNVAWTNPRYFPGVPTADFNRDGKLDILGEEVWPSSTVSTPLFQNIGATEAYLDVAVDIGPNQPNRQGIGAVVKVYEAGKAGNAAYLLGSAIIQTGNGYVSGSMAIAHFGLPKYEQYATGSNARVTGGWSAARSFVDVVVTMPDNGATFTATVPTNHLTVMPGGGSYNQRPTASFTADIAGATVGNLLTHFDASVSADPDGLIVAYQWNFGDGNIGTGVAPNHTYGAFGSYTVTLTVIDNRGDSASQVVGVELLAPAISTQPASQSIVEGQWATFTVVATGTPALSYQWQKNTGGGWASVSGAIGASYTTPAALLADNGTQYRCVVTSRFGVATSNAAGLAVGVATAVSIASQPANAAVSTGRKARFDVQVAGSWPFAYQWQQNTGGGWADIAGASGAANISNAVLTFWSPLSAVTGTQYRVRVSNNLATVTSNAATLTIAAPQTVTEDWQAPAAGQPWPSQWTKQDISAGCIATVQNGTLPNKVGQITSGGHCLMYINTTTAEDVEQVVWFSINNNSINPGIIARRQDSDSDTYYGVDHTTTYKQVGYIFKMVDGVRTNLIALPAGTNGPNWLRFKVQTNGSGTDLKAKLWLASGSEPTAWSAEITDTEAKLQGVSGRFGLRDQTTLGRGVSFDNYTATILRGTNNVAPVAAFTAAPVSGEEPLSVVFDASTSSDPVGRIVSYAWDFGDGSSGSGKTASHQYTLSDPNTAQSYSAVLTVTDEDGLTAQYTRSIQVQPLTDHIPPRVASQVFNLGSTGRAFFRTIELGFSEAVTVAKGDLLVWDHTAGAFVDTASVVFSIQGNNAMWDLSALNLTFGRYTATLSSASVKDGNNNALDGDGNGTGGDNYVLDFHVLPGDANGDAIVDVGDLGLLAAAYGDEGNWWQNPCDFNADGIVDVGDLGILATWYGVEPPPAGGGAGGTVPAEAGAVLAAEGVASGSLTESAPATTAVHTAAPAAAPLEETVAEPVAASIDPQPLTVALQTAEVTTAPAPAEETVQVITTILADESSPAEEDVVDLLSSAPADLLAV